MTTHQPPPLSTVPAFWQDRIHKLRSENFSLRQRLKGRAIPANASMEELPVRWQRTIRKMRQESKSLRDERNQLRTELEALRASEGK